MLVQCQQRIPGDQNSMGPQSCLLRGMLIQHWQVNGLLTGSLQTETELAWPFMGTAESVNFRASRAMDGVCDQSYSRITSSGLSIPTCLY